MAYFLPKGRPPEGGRNSEEPEVLPKFADRDLFCPKGRPPGGGRNSEEPEVLPKFAERELFYNRRKLRIAIPTNS